MTTPPNSTRIAFDVVIDLAGHRLLRDVDQPLESKAFGALALLAQAPGDAMARAAVAGAPRKRVFGNIGGRIRGEPRTHGVPG